MLCREHALFNKKNMSKYIDVDCLRKEIDHRIDILEDMSIKCAKNDDMEMHAYYHGKSISLQELLPFVDSLQQEQPSLPDNLDEAAEEYMKKARKHLFDDSSIGRADDAFKAGARWAMQQLKGE